MHALPFQAMPKYAYQYEGKFYKGDSKDTPWNNVIFVNANIIYAPELSPWHLITSLYGMNRILIGRLELRKSMQ